MMIEPQYPEIVKILAQRGVHTQGTMRRFIESHDPDEVKAFLADWDLWRLPYQVMPEGKWRRWILRCGRGTGKTHTGARTTSEVARDRQKIKTGEIGIIGRTHADARFTMVEGPSGILAQAPVDFRPAWEPGNSVLTWPNGVRGRLFSADKPEQMRGPNFAWIWGDEPAHWPDGETTWMEVLEPALRVGWARAMLTTTPIPGTWLSKIEALDDTEVTRASTFENSYLAKGVRDGYRKMFEGTRTGRQELYGDILEDNEKALWNGPELEQHRLHRMPVDAKRIVVAIDPAVTANKNSDESGIVVCALGTDGHGYMLADRSGIHTPAAWAKVALAAYSRFRADLILGEVNNGGDLVEANIRAADDRANFKAVRASRGKVTRAEPIAALSERGMIHLVGNFPVLEEQLTQWDPSKAKSPDRLDAFVWGFTELMIAENDKAGPISAYL